MPKIFLTGSNITKGYLTGSGYLNNSSRIQIREKDNKTNTYPMLHRLGEITNYAQKTFVDNNVINFGKRIHDNFLIKNKEFEIPVSTNDWVVGNPEVLIKREDLLFYKRNKNIKINGIVSLGGNSNRWIRTKEKVKNPTMILKLLCNEYDYTTTVNKALSIYPTLSNTDTLKIQISSDLLTWQTITLEERNINNPYVNIISGQLDPTSQLFQREALPYLPKNLDNKRKPEFIVKIDFDQLNLSSSPSDAFYIRIIQSSISNTSEIQWGISEINILSREQNILMPSGLERQNSKHLTSSFSSPNELGNIQIDNGMSLSYVSENFIETENTENQINPFNDNKYIVNNNISFYNHGVENTVYLGLDYPLQSKTMFEVDLSTNEKTDLGLLYKDTTGGNAAKQEITGSGGLESNLMVYWNKDLKRWEKIGWPIGVNDYGADTIGDDIVHLLTASAIGFSSVGVIASGSNATGGIDSTATLLPESILNSYNRPTDTFGFPFSARYYATSSQYITAKDLGITKPFILEKAVLDFDISAKINADLGGIVDFLYMQNKYYSESTGTSAILHFTPSFFILNQKKSNFENIEIQVYTGSKESDVITYAEELPRFIQLQSSSVDLTYVDTTRELITYGQHTFVCSSSYNFTNFTPNITFDDFVKTPIVRDNVTILNAGNKRWLPTLTSFYFTGSFRTEFPCRNTAKITPFSPYYVCQSPGTAMGAPSGGVYGKYANIRMGKEKIGRSNGIISSEARSLVNGYSAFKPSGDEISIQYNDIPEASGTSFFTNPVVVAADDGVDLVSPYIIFPEDKLIFGWQAPLNFRRVSADILNSYMTLFGNSKLKLYGSQLKTGKEVHEGLNQNLVTNVVHEIIGNELITDKFEIATRQELTGSYLAMLPASNDSLVFGRNIFDKSIFIFTSESRIGVENYDIINKELMSSLPAVVKGLVAKNEFNFSLNDQKRYFLDSKYSIGEFLNNSYYGIIPSFIIDTNYSIKGTSEKMKKMGNYIFSNNHYGYHSDFIRQGLDSAFIDDPRTTLDDIVTLPPVRINFVSGERVNDVDIRKFSFKRNDEINGTSENEFQSSNLSLYATSSLPFYDDGIVLNRTYGEETILV